MAVRVIGLICREVAGVDIAPIAVPARTGSRAGPLQKLDDARVRGGEPPRELHRIALVVPALGRHGVLVVRRDRRPVLVDAALHPVGEELGRRLPSRALRSRRSLGRGGTAGRASSCAARMRAGCAPRSTRRTHISLRILGTQAPAPTTATREHGSRSAPAHPSLTARAPTSAMIWSR